MKEHALKALMNRVATGKPLSATEMGDAFEALMSDEALPTQRAAFLMALRARGETISELTGAAQLLRSKMVPVTAPDDAVDIVGTGGDGHGTYNVSTCAALVAAGAGLNVAKHGNRSVSSKSGASDVLQALGVKVDVGPEVVSRAIKDAGVGFMWAPMHHPAMKHWAPVRADLGVRTIFNMIGPICNPASVKRQIVGVFDRTWLEPMAHALKNIGVERACVVCGSDGMDELTTTGPSHVAELRDGEISQFDITPEEAGLARVSIDALKGGDAEVNATAIRDVLGGASNAFREIVLFNAGAALMVGGKAENVADGVTIAAKSIDNGAASAALQKLIDVSNAGV